MSEHQKITRRDQPDELRATAERHVVHLRLALKIALNRARRSKPLLRDLLSAATVEGLADGLNAKVAAVSFQVPHLGQTWHQLLPWEALEGEPPAATATTVAWSLRESVRRYSADRVPAE